MNHDRSNLAALAPGQHYEAEDLLLYALEMLTPAEIAAVEEHLRSCAQCSQELAAVREEIGLFAVASVESVPLEGAPARSRDRLMAEIAQAGRVAHIGATAGSLPTPAATGVAGQSVTSKPAMALITGGKPARSSRVPAWIGWGIAAAMTVVAAHFYQDREALRGSLTTQSGQIAQLSAERARAREIVEALTDRSAQRVALTLTKSPPPVQPTGRATYLANKGTLIFLASHLDPLPAGKTYELWVIPISGASPVPAGTFRPDERGNANVVTDRLAGTGAAKAIGVTIEALGGSPTPTMPIVLAGS